MAPDRAARLRPGARASGSRTAARSSRPSSSSATASSRSTRSATRTCGCSTARTATSSALRPDGRVRRSIARSFRAAPELLAFTNDLFSSIDTGAARRRLPVHVARSVPGGAAEGAPGGRLDLVAASEHASAAAAIAAGGGAAPRRRRGARPPDRPAAAGSSRRHRHPVQVALEPSRDRVGARITRDSRPTSTRASGSSTRTK